MCTDSNYVLSQVDGAFGKTRHLENNQLYYEYCAFLRIESFKIKTVRCDSCDDTNLYTYSLRTTADEYILQ